jgi:1-acyl-sn-glycerol-3-phosphate acyltransferase
MATVMGHPRRSRPVKLLVKLTGIALQFGRGAWIVTLRFPAWQKPQRLQAIQRWARQMLAILEIEVHSNQLPQADFAGLVVSNHLSWLDILVLQSLMPGCFVAKTEVRHWPVVGYLATACATIFVDRSSPRSARSMVDDTAAAITEGYAVVVFPEGTSSNGQALGSFHANIFESAIRAQAPVQLLSLQYLDTTTGRAAAAAHFIDDMTLMGSLKSVMATSTIQARVHIGDCISAHGHSRKSLALHAHEKICAHLFTPSHTGL